MRNTITIIFLFLGFLGFGQEFQFKTEKTTNDYYNDITFLSAGPCVSLDKPIKEIYGYYYRLVIITSEIYNTLFIEKITFGDEGGNVKLVSIMKIPIENVYKKFELNGEITNIEFVKWLNATSFIIIIQKKQYRISDIMNESIKIKRM